jgi:hypothetical protein
MSEQTPEAIKAVANEIAPIAEVPTPGNSKRKTDSSQLPANQDSPAPAGDACC